MKVTVDATQFLSRLLPCAQVADRKSPRFHGTCVLLAARADSLELRAFRDPVDIRVTVATGLTVHRPGLVAVPAKDFVERIQLMDGPITLEYAEKRVTISGTGKRRYSLRADPGIGFPIFPIVDGETTTMPAATLRGAIASVQYAASKDLENVRFAGMSLMGRGEKTAVVAGMGHRMARVVIDVPSVSDLFIPSQAVASLTGAFREVDGDVRLSFSGGVAAFSVDGFDVAYRRPDVSIPPFDVLIEMMQAVDGPRVPRIALLEAVKAVSVSSTPGSTPVWMRHTGTALQLRHRSLTDDENEEEVATDGGPTWTTAVEAEYLEQALAAMQSDVVRVCVNEDDFNEPLMVRGDGEVAAIAPISKDKWHVGSKEAA